MWRCWLRPRYLLAVARADRPISTCNQRKYYDCVMFLGTNHAFGFYFYTFTTCASLFSSSVSVFIWSLILVPHIHTTLLTFSEKRSIAYTFDRLTFRLVHYLILRYHQNTYCDVFVWRVPLLTATFLFVHNTILHLCGCVILFAFQYYNIRTYTLEIKSIVNPEDFTYQVMKALANS